MTTLYNPTENNLSIQYKGIIYTLPAGKSVEFPDEVASYWHGKIHQFLEIDGGSSKEATEPVEEVKVSRSRKSNQ
jgi:hypothetical protein